MKLNIVVFLVIVASFLTFASARMEEKSSMEDTATYRYGGRYGGYGGRYGGYRGYGGYRRGRGRW